MKVLLITKLNTTNIGNQALSYGIFNQFRKISELKLSVIGRPRGLEGYTIQRIQKAEDSITLFRKWVNEITADVTKNYHTEFFETKELDFKLSKLTKSEKNFEKIKSLFRPIKRYLMKYLKFGSQYSNRIQLLSQADWLIYSGAGEVGDNNVFLRQLLEIACAQKIGLKTAAVNQSIVIHTDLFKSLLKEVYGKMDKIVVRGEDSSKLLVDSGVNKSIIDIAPDSALIDNLKELRVNSAKRSVIGINFTSTVNFDNSKFAELVMDMSKKGYSFEFITNEPYGDRDIISLFSKKFNIPCKSVFVDFNEYTNYLSELKFVISARLHTCILALNSNTVVIPIEGNSFKTNELLTQLNYPLKVLNGKDEIFYHNLKDNIDFVLSNDSLFENYFNSILVSKREKVKLNALWITNFITVINE